jgi:tRNA modification GTPase
MNLYLDERPIIACSTGTTTNTAIAIIRLSGFESLTLLSPFFSTEITNIKPRFSHLTNLIFRNAVIDNILFTYFPADSSFNGENIVELSVHGNQLNISRIIDFFISTDLFRAAGPGEFSYRALKNGKLSLSQVEGLDMLLNANSNLMLDQGMQILQGELHQKYIALYDSFLKLKAAVEISIDFSDDVGEVQTQALLSTTLVNFKEILTSLYERTRSSVSSLMSPDVVICGETNAGKSSLFNLLLKHNRSIVSSIPGTTRDYVSEYISMNGTNFRLVDTAGVRDSQDVIEKEGIDRAFDLLSNSFFKVLVIDPHLFNPEYLKKFSNINFDLIIFSHCDEDNFSEKLALFSLDFLSANYFLVSSLKSGSIGPVGNFSFGPIEPLKATGPIEPLIKSLVSNKYNNLSMENPILLDRHRSCISNSYIKFIEFERNLNNLDDIAIVSSELNILSVHLSELLGIISPDGVLNSIFANFCIGK